MEEKRYKLSGVSVLSVPETDADKLLALGDGTCALLYLYILRCGGAVELSAAARAMGRTEEELSATAETLRKTELLQTDESRLPPPDELPEYRAEDIVRRSREDPAFGGLVAEAQRNLGHSLSGPDLKTLFGIYDRLGLPTEVIMLIFNRCSEVIRRRHGEGRRPTMRAIEKEAYIWADREILTAAQAEEYLKSLDRRDEAEEKLRSLLQIRGRASSPTERKYMDSWLSAGYSMEVLALAYDRTVVGTGKLSWAYMDKILRSWQEKGLHTPEEIRRGDGRRPARPTSGSRNTTPSGQDDLDRLERLLGNKR